jgi:hypothetical protein
VGRLDDGAFVVRELLAEQKGVIPLEGGFHSGSPEGQMGCSDCRSFECVHPKWGVTIVGGS